jgi:SAM-dependent methyltransferase
VHEVDKEKLLARYAQRIEKLGHGTVALGEPKGRQAFYFDFLAQVDGLEPSDSIIDVGCGYGDLFDYLRGSGWRGSYLGVDINRELIEEGKRLYPDAEFRVLDIQETPLTQVSDWFFCCHALTSATEALPFIEHFESMLQLMWSCSRKGVVFNVLSPLADYTNPVHARPAFGEVLEVIAKLTNRFTVRHDYMPYEYAVYAYKENAIDRTTLVFTSHKDLLRNLTDEWQKRRLNATNSNSVPSKSR